MLPGIDVVHFHCCFAFSCGNIPQFIFLFFINGLWIISNFWLLWHNEILLRSYWFCDCYLHRKSRSPCPIHVVLGLHYIYKFLFHTHCAFWGQLPLGPILPSAWMLSLPHPGCSCLIQFRLSFKQLIFTVRLYHSR